MSNRYDRCLLAWILAISWVSVSRAQLPDYHVHAFDDKFGLRTDIQRLTKDNKEFLWLLSTDRVHRFDGRTVSDFDISDRLYEIYCDSSGNIWTNSRSAVYRYNHTRGDFAPVSVMPELTSGIGRVFQLPGKSPWLHTADGFYEWDDATLAFQAVEETGGTRRPYSASAFGTYGSVVFTTASDTVFAIDTDRPESILALPCKDALAIHPLSERLALVTVRGVVTVWCDFETGIVTPITPSRDIAGSIDDFLFVRKVVRLSKDNYLVATHSGLLGISGPERRIRRLSLYERGKPLDPSPYFNDLYVDPNGTAWLAHGIGLIRFDPLREQIGLLRNREAREDKAWLNVARGFAEDEKGNLWVATSQGFGYWDLRDNSMTMHHPSAGARDRLNQPSLRGLVYDGQYLIMGTSNGGTWMYHPAQQTYRRPLYADHRVMEKHEREFIRIITPLPSGQIFISGSSSYLLDPDTYVLSECSEIAGGAQTCYVDPKKQVWITTDDQLYCFDSEMTLKATIPAGMEIAALCMLNDSTLFAGTADGIYTISTTEVGVVMRKAALTPVLNRIAFVIQDSAGDFWIGCDEGLGRYQPDSGTIEMFDVADQIQGSAFIPNAWYLNSEGMLFLGGLNGINYFRPAHIAPRAGHLTVSLMGVTANGISLSGDPVVLAHDQNALEIEYAAPFYGNIERLEYRYRINGGDWSSNGNSGEIRFPALSHGEYTFEVAASVNGRDWFAATTPLRLTILPPFWKEWWFIALVVLLVAGVVLAVVRRRIHSIRKQEEEKRRTEIAMMQVNQDLAASRLTALRAQMNPHFIFNALNSIQRYVLQGDVDQANKYLAKFSRLQREVLNHSSRDFISLETELEILELYLQLEQLRFEDRFEYQITLEESLDPNEISIPPMILQPFVENAIWHGLMHRNGTKRLDIEFTLRDEDVLCCRILDNGVGREAAARMRQTESARLHQSKGLKLVEERLHILEQLYRRPFRLEILDRQGVSGQVEGTEVRLMLSIQQQITFKERPVVSNSGT